MAVTAQQVFELTMDLIDEREDTGNISEANTKTYKVKTPGILTILQAEITNEAAMITSITDNLTVDDLVALKVLPYGLAAHLLLEENPSSASFFNDRYEELKRRIPSSEVPITDVYGVFSWPE